MFSTEIAVAHNEMTFRTRTVGIKTLDKPTQKLRDAPILLNSSLTTEYQWG